MSELPHITESEWAIMDQLWAQAPLTVAQLVERVQRDKPLAVTTVKTLLRRLIAKQAIGFTIDEHNQKLYYYFPLVQEQDCVEKESRHFLSLYYKDNVQKMFTTFVDKSDLSDEEIDMLTELLERKKGDSDQ